MVEFFFTPEEAQPIALALHAHLEKSGFKVKVEASVDESAPLKPTLVAEAEGRVLFVETQGDPNYSESLKELVKWAIVNRVNGEVYMATSSEKSIKIKDADHMRRDGIGLFLVNEEDHCYQSEAARNPALMVSVEPTLYLGKYKQKISALVRDFNSGNRKGAAQGVCELVEQETKALAMKAAKKNWLDRTETVIEGMDWSSRINVLGSKDRYTGNRAPLVDTDLKNDLQSLRGARNKFDHPAPNRKAERQRQIQFAERTIQGARLIDELLKLKRKVK